VDVLDINDNSPTFPVHQISLEISEATPIGSLFMIPVADDADSGEYGLLTYQLLSDFDQFELHITGNVGESKDVRLKLVDSLDREARSHYVANVLAVDGGQPHRSGSIVVNIEIVDSKDKTPRWNNASYETQIYENMPVSFFIIINVCILALLVCLSFSASVFISVSGSVAGSVSVSVLMPVRLQFLQ